MSARVKSMIGGHSRCRPCSTIVAPPRTRASTLSLETWSAISAPKPPEAVYADAASTRALVRHADERGAHAAPGDAARRRRRPRTGRRSRRQVVGGESSGCAAPVAVGELAQPGRRCSAKARAELIRPALRASVTTPNRPPRRRGPSGLAPPSAVPSPQPRSRPRHRRGRRGWRRRRQRLRPRGRSVRATVVALRVGAAVRDAFAVGARLEGDVVVSDGHAVLLLDRRGPAPRPVFGQRNERAAGWRWVDSRPAPDAHSGHDRAHRGEDFVSHRSRSRCSTVLSVIAA